MFIKVRHFNLPAVRWVRCAPSHPVVPRPHRKTSGNIWLSGINCLHLFRSWITGHLHCLQISFVNPSLQFQICTLWNLNCLCMYVRLHPLWPQRKRLHTTWTTDYMHTRQDRWIQTKLVFTLTKNATKPNPLEIIPLQTTRKKKNRKTEKNDGESNCESGGGTDQRVQSLMFMMMMMMMVMYVCT